MEFNDSLINVTRWIEPTADPEYLFYGKTTVPSPPPPDPDYMHLEAGKGRIQVAANLFPTPPTQPPSSGNGKLCLFEFNITRYPTSDTISSLLHINLTDTYLLDPNVNEVNPIIKEDGSFDYILAATPTLRLVESPQFIQFTPYQNMTGGSFSTTVSVDGPASEAGLTNASFTLSYDSSVLSTSESNVILNNVWVGSHGILIETGQVTVSVSNPSPLPSEQTVVICMITFTVQGQQTVPPQPLGGHIDTNINFTSTTLLNSAGNAITQMPPYNQTVRIYAYQTETTILSIGQPMITWPDTAIYNSTQFAVNVSITALYNPSFIQVKLLYDQSAITCTRVISIGDADLDEFAGYVSQPGMAIANVSISGHTNLTVSGPIFRFEFRAVAENVTSYLNFSQPYGQDTFIQDSSGAIANVTYSEIVIHVSETPRPHLVLVSSKNHLDTTVGTQCSFELTMTNEGSVKANNVSLSSYGVPSSWLQFSKNGFSVAPNSMENVTVTVIPTGAGEFNLTIAAASTDGNTANTTLTLSVSEPATNPPWELIIPAIIIGIGTIITFTVIRSRRRKKIT
jgi:hypothetical protein